MLGGALSGGVMATPGTVSRAVNNRRTRAAESAAEVQREAENAAPVQQESTAIDTDEDRQDARTIVAKLSESIPKLRDAEPVTTLSGNEFGPGKKTLREQVADFFGSIGNKVFRKGLGDVDLTMGGIRSDIAHGMGRAKAVTFAAVPEVISRGQQIDYQQNWKGRGYDSYVFAAPVTIGETRSYVAAVVLRDSSNRFYLHEAVDENGNFLKITQDTPDVFKTGVTVQDGITSTPEVSIDSISQAARDVNTEQARPAAVRAYDTARMVRAGAALGESGEKALNASYDPTIPADRYYRGFSEYYEAGVQGRSESDVKQDAFTSALNSAQRYAAYSAGRNDAAASLAREERAKNFAKTAGGDSGLVFDDYVSRELDETTANRINAVAKRLGTRVRFTEPGSIRGGTANAAVSGAEVLIEKNNPNPVMFLLGHEWTHRLQELAPQEYRKFRQAAAGVEDVRLNAERTAELYHRQGVELTYEEALDEAAADYAGQMLDEDGAVLDRFIAEHRDDRTLLQRVRDAIRSLVNRLTGRERRGAESAVRKLDEALRAAERQAARLSENSGNAREGGGKYAIKYDRNNTPYVVIEEDILAGVPRSEWVRTVKDNLRKKFPNGVVVGNNVININARSRNEMTFSEYTKWLVHEEPDIYADKLRSTNNADEILRAARNWTNEALLHPRADTIIDFARGEVQMLVGDRGYTAQVIVGNRGNGPLLLYDIINLLPTTIQQKTTDAEISLLPVKGPGGRSSASVIENSISENGENVNRKFSMKEPVEETRDLLALHNLTEDKLMKSIRLGGFPMPSIAVTRSDIPHTNFGDISLVMRKETIDPEADSRNTVYSADAWTPTFPQIEYEADEKAASRIRGKFYDLYHKFGRETVNALYGYGNYLEDELNRYGGVDGILARERDNPDMMKVYLADTGAEIPADVTTETVTRLSDAEIERLEHIANYLGSDVFDDMRSRDGENTIQARRRWMNEHGDAFEDAYRSYMESIGISQEGIENVLANENPGSLSRLAVEVRNYLRNGPETRNTQVDTAATRQAVRDAVDQDAYEAWLEDLFAGAEKSSGVYNNRERYTSSGNQRSFRQTHYPVTLENIARAMAEQNNGDSKNVSGFHGLKTLRAGTADRFSSIRQMHEMEGRLRHLTEEEAEQINDALGDRLSDVTRRIYDTKPHSEYDNEFIDMDTIGEIMMEVAEQKEYTAESIRKVFGKYRYKLSLSLAEDVRALLFDIKQMPVNIFEAKPERAVGFDEVLAAVIPDSTGTELREGLRGAGVRIIEYKAGDEADRMRAVNSVEDAKFSMKGTETNRETAELERENARLRERIERLRQNTRITTRENATAKRSDIDRLAGEILKEYGIRLHKTDVMPELQKLGDAVLRAGSDTAWEDIHTPALELARRMVENADVLNDEDYRRYSELRRELRETKINMPRELWGDFDSDGGYNAFRKKNMGRLNLSGTGGISADTVYEELVEMYPEFFDADLLNETDRLHRMADVLDGLRPVYENPYSGDTDRAAEYIAQDIIDRLLGEDVRQNVTYADRQERKRNEQRQKYLAALERVRTQRDAKLQALERRYRARTEKARERQSAAKLRAQITRHASDLSQRLLSPSDKRHVPEALRAPVAALLDAINRESPYTYDENGVRHRNAEGSPTARTEAFTKLREQYAKIIKDGGDMVIDPALLGDAASGFDGLFDEVIAMRDVRLADMNTEQLEKVWQTLRAVEHSVSSAGKILSQAKFARTAEWAEAFRRDTDSRRQKRSLTKLHPMLGLETPFTFFHHYGEVYIAFYPEQIKLADNRNPTSDPDIRYSFEDDMPEGLRLPSPEDEDISANTEFIDLPTQEDVNAPSGPRYEAERIPMPEDRDAPDASYWRKKLSTRARSYFTRAMKEASDTVAARLGVPKGQVADTVGVTLDALADMYMTDGTLDENTVTDAFETVYNSVTIIDGEYYEMYKPVRKYLRETTVYVSDAVKNEFTDWGSFRRSVGSRIKIRTGEGAASAMAVDEVYSELSQTWPDLFPDDISVPSSQLERMDEVYRSIERVEKTLDEAAGESSGEVKQAARHDFNEAVYDLVARLRDVRNFERSREVSRTAKDAKEAENRDKLLKNAEARGLSEEEAASLYKTSRAQFAAFSKAKALNLLTDSDRLKLGQLLRGEIQTAALNAETDNVRGITAVYEAARAYEDTMTALRGYEQSRAAALRDEAAAMLEGAEKWHDKSKGYLYARETAERNVRDVVGDDEKAQKLIDTYFTPVHKNEAESTKMKNLLRDTVRALALSRRVKKGNSMSEAAMVQFVGEAEDYIEVLSTGVNAGNPKAKRGGMTLEEWRGALENAWKENPNIDRAKIENAVETFRKLYDYLFKKINEVRVRNGYEPISYRRGYFPHFQSEKRSGVLGWLGKAFGVQTEVTNLPTTINGRTEDFKPGIRWMGAALERKGNKTDFDAVEGFDRYLEVAADVIWHTDDIQRLRALATATRERTTDESIAEYIERVRQNDTIDEQEKQTLISEKRKEGRYELSNFAGWLDEYTNLLAGKKSRADRQMEADAGRGMYNVLKALESRVGANMVGFNVRSATTNFIPITQGWADLGGGTVLRGMWDTLKAHSPRAKIAKAIKNGGASVGDIIEALSDNMPLDNFSDMSEFLTNRRGSERLVQTRTQEIVGKVPPLRLARNLMETVDRFSSETLVRARYAQNVKRGLSEQSAMDEADAWAAGVMAARSKGSMPTLFSRANPLTKLFTQFQLEVNNQFSYLMKDVPREHREKGLASLAWALLKFAIGAWLFNELSELITGYRPALDPIGILNDTVGDLTGYELPNVFRLAKGAITGDMPSFETEQEGVYGAGKNLAKNVAEELPFVGGLLGGGRIPISSAKPSFTNLWSAATNPDWAPEKKLRTAADELSKPFTYLLPPAGGGAVRRVIEGAATRAAGGSYTVNSKGEDILQYPEYTDEGAGSFWDVVKSMIMGKSSLDTAQDWVRSGFDSLSAKQTTAYREMTDAGMGQRDAFELLREIEGDEMTKAEKMRAVVDATDIEEARLAAMKTVLTEAAYDKVAAAGEFGVSSESWTELMETLPDYDDGNGSYTQAEVADALGSMKRLTREEKAVLWQAQAKNWSPKKNPYDTRLGEEVADRLNREEEEEEMPEWVSLPTP